VVNRAPADPGLISLHGGHSGEFCSHAAGTLEEVIRSYVGQGFTRVGITEHMPPAGDRWLYPDETAAGLDSAALYRRFARYIDTGRRLQEAYASAITIYLGFETEAWPGYGPAVRSLVKTFRPDYLVGSVHHVAGLPFDYSPADYLAAAEKAGGVDGLYRRYFDLQLEMIERLRPGVVGHLDLIRIHDPGWENRLEKPEIAGRVRRNLERMKEFSLILDCDCRLLPDGGETYPARKILLWARELGVAAVPGDDSHSPEEAGRGIREGIELLQELGFSTDWPLPSMVRNRRS
jgi:histidinol-phosphatase (PHP family)